MEAKYLRHADSFVSTTFFFSVDGKEYRIISHKNRNMVLLIPKADNSEEIFAACELALQDAHEDNLL